jgi:hypothetical protein
MSDQLHPLSQAMPIADGFPDVQVGHRDVRRFYHFGLPGT